MSGLVDNLIWMQQNFRNLPDRKIPIYRVFSVHRFLETVSDRTLTLVPPEVWDDPFENLVLRHVLFRNLNVRLYGQCWTANVDETDALWRIYSQDKNGVRVRSTVDRLFAAITDLSRQSAPVEYWIGKVRYLTETNIRAELENPRKLQDGVLGSGAIGLVETLLIKRREFEHENEIRLIYCAHSHYRDLTEPVVKFPIAPNDVFDEALFDPRMPPAAFEAYRDRLRAIGFAGTVEQSQLYQVPNLKLALP